MKVLEYSALKLILVLNLIVEAVTMRQLARKLGRVPTTVHVMMVSVVMEQYVLL